jgi:hypothetical protein
MSLTGLLVPTYRNEHCGAYETRSRNSVRSFGTGLEIRQASAATSSSERGLKHAYFTATLDAAAWGAPPSPPDLYRSNEVHRIPGPVLHRSTLMPCAVFRVAIEECRL